MRNQTKKKAFTLVEMMAVVVIIGILAAVIAPKIFNQVNKTSVTAAKQDIESLSNAVTLYRLDTSKFPYELRDLLYEPDDVRNWNGPYLSKRKIPRDPWGNEYQYASPGNDGREFDIWSLGEDAQEGGDGLAEDITSWAGEED